MSGAGRKGPYRKGVTEEVMHGTPVPGKGEVVARVKAPRGANVIEVVSGADGSTGLAILPTKFRKLVWVKRGDYVIIAGSTEDIEVSDGNIGAVNFRVSAVLYKDQVRHIKQQGLWPQRFADGTDDAAAAPGGGEEQAASEQPRSNTPPKAPSKKLPLGSDCLGTLGTVATSLPPPAPTLERGGQPATAAEAAADYQEDDEGSSEEDEGDSDLFVNQNRRKFAPQLSSSEEEDSDEDE